MFARASQEFVFFSSIDTSAIVKIFQPGERLYKLVDGQLNNQQVLPIVHCPVINEIRLKRSQIPVGWMAIFPSAFPGLNCQWFGLQKSIDVTPALNEWIKANKQVISRRPGIQSGH